MDKILLLIIVGMIVTIGYFLFNFIQTHGFFELFAIIFIILASLFFGGLGLAIINQKKV